ncbi:N-chimaerin [Clonorchis sinensis]|uniref:Beta-chimaerin n=1 Tax=Clonorchis sinensis TaxID=79923 RepID=A0A8T1MDA7_CLOSI|nr:N-chimaerin [Clonorchis sinensis]
MSENNLEFRIWQTQLYHLQREAPKPHMVICTRTFPNKPPQYGLEYHGPISRQETEKLLEDAPDGAYLIRESQRSEDAYTLVIWFDKVARNYKLFYDAEKKQHYVGEKRFDTIELLVADGLIHFNVETRGADVLRKIAETNLYEKSPFYKMRYHTLNYPNLSSVSTRPSTATPSQEHESTVLPWNLDETHPSMPADLVSDAKRKGVLSTDVLARRPGISNRKRPPTFTSSLSDETNILANTEGRHYREWPPLAGLRGLSLDEATLNKSDLSEPPMPPPRGVSGLKSTSVYVETLHQNGMNTSQPGIVRPSVQRMTPMHERLGLNNSGLTTTYQLPNNVIVPSSAQQAGKLFDIPEIVSGERVSSPKTVFSNSQDFNTTSSLVSSGTFSSEEENPTGAAFQMDSSSATAAVNLRDSDTIPNASETLGNGNKKQAVLTLLERYNLPAECLADQVTPCEPVKKKHSFKVHTYLGPNWCDFCTHFIWGLVAQGVKCQDCGFQAHKRCSDLVPDDCPPDVNQMKRVFGVDLTSLTLAERKTIPILLERCVGEVETRGALVCEGLYRVPGNHDRIEQLRAAFDKDAESAGISQSQVPDVNVITSLIKSFLRQLPVPLITFDVYPKLMDIVREDNLTDGENLSGIASVLSTLPPAHYETLRFFMRHIHRVAVNHEKNMMSAENLSTVLAPSLMSSSYTDPQSCIAGMQTERKLVRILIRDYNALFPGHERSIRRHATFEPQYDRPNSQLIASAALMQYAANRPVPREPEQSKRRFLRNRRSVDTPLLTSGSTEKTTTPVNSPI